MKDIKHAQAMFDIAANDLKALKGMDDVDTFTNTKESLDRSSVLRDILKFAEHVKGLLNS